MNRQSTYGIWCKVTGGMTGRREAWLKQGGELYLTDDEAEAIETAKVLEARMNAMAEGGSLKRRATFSYQARRYQWLTSPGEAS